MNSQDKLFLQNLKEGIKEDITEIKENIKEVKQENKQSHQATSEEIKGLTNGQNKMAIQVTRIDERLENHLDTSEKKENRKFAQKINKPQVILAVFGGVAIVITMVMAVIGILK